MNLIKLLHNRKRSVTPPTLTQEEFYESLFTQSDEWSNPNPNSEEKLRWEIIENFIFYIKGYNAEIKIEQSKILDLGCGRGWLTNLLSKHGKIKGIEPIKPVVEYANTIFPELDIEHGTSKNLIEKGFINEFDLIVSSEVIEHIDDQLKPDFVNDIKLLLKDGGFALITTPRKDAEEEWKKYIDPNQPIEDWLTESSLEQLFVNSGFKKHLKKTFSIRPNTTAPEIEIYQVWLFQK